MKYVISTVFEKNSLEILIVTFFIIIITIKNCIVLFCILYVLYFDGKLTRAIDTGIIFFDTWIFGEYLFH